MKRQLTNLFCLKKLQSDVFRNLHNELGHMGIDRTLDMVPKMAADVEHKIKTCGRCMKLKVLPGKLLRW